MVSTIRYSANASSDHHPNQVPGILIIMNPKQPNLPTCSVTSTYLLFHLLSNPSLHLIANTTLGIIMTAIKISPKTLNHSILSTITNFDLSLTSKSIIPHLYEFFYHFDYLETETDKSEGLQRFIDKVKQITQPTKLTPELVHEFIEKIVIHERRYLDGKRYQLMDIYYNGVGVIRGLTPEDMEEAFQEHLAKRKINKAKTA